MAIPREPLAAAAERYDAIVVGGGVYGISLALEAARRRQRVLLVERDDFGGATSRNHLRIIHGGFRYLQSADLPRFFESVAERRWFLRSFPELIHPLPCLMPLYGRGVRRNPVMQLGLWANDLLSFTRNRGVRADRELPGGRIVNPERVSSFFPGAPRDGLRGGAIWYDAFAPDPQRVLVEMLHRACGLGAAVLNYVEATDLLRSEREVEGIRARDRVTGAELELRAPVVVNAAGPWSRELAEAFDRDRPELFQGTLAWNLLLDREPLSDHALALTADRPGAQNPNAKTLFLVPWKGRMLAGTAHAPWSGVTEQPLPPPDLQRGFLRDLNEAAPGLELDASDVLRIYAGLLPGVRTGSAELARRPVILDHRAHGGPDGLWSVSGIKFTTARRVAAAILDRCLPSSEILSADAEAGGAARRARTTRFGPSWKIPDADGDADASWADDLRLIIEEESVVYLDDLLVRRTSLADHPGRAEELAPRLCELFPWDEARRALELERLKPVLASARST